MSARHHVLLIGIDAYNDGGMLAGCVNDIDAVQRLLIDRVKVPAAHVTRLAAPRTGAVHETDVPSSAPTLANIRAALDLLGSNAVAEGDRVFIYYSGHGTQCIITDGSGRRFSREALVPKDKRIGTQYRFLYDWELNAAIAAIARRKAAVTVVLDCCSSAGATRGGTGVQGTLERFWPTTEVHSIDGEGPPTDLLRGMATLGAVRACQVVAACRDDERARESAQAHGPQHGVLTRALLHHLAAIPTDELTDLRWGRVWRQVEADVRAENPYQNPWMSGSFGRRPFGLGPDEDADPGYAVERVGSGYRLDVGELAGVTVDAEIAVYGSTPLSFPELGTAADLDARAGSVRVVACTMSSCEAIAIEPFELPVAPRGRLVRSGRAARLRVALLPEDATLAAQLAASPLVEQCPIAQAEVVLVQTPDGGWAITDDVHGTGEISAGEPVLGIIPSDRPEFARSAVEHYHAYITPLRMARACRDLPCAISLWLLDCNGRTISPAEAQSPNLPQLEAAANAPYEMAPGDRVCFAVENHFDEPLSVTLIDCAASGKVLLLGEKRIPAHTRHVFWADESLGNPFAASLPEDRAIGVDRIVAIATTRPNVSLAHLARRTSFADVLQPRRSRAAFRDLGGETRPTVERWTAATTLVRIASAGAAKTDAWIRLTGTPDTFASQVQIGSRSFTCKHQLPLTDAEIDAVVPWASGGEEWMKRGTEAVDLALAVGTRMFRALFDGPLGQIYELHRMSNRELRLRLSIEDPRLSAMPWEFLHDGKDFVSLSTNTTLLRTTERAATTRLPYPPLSRPLHVLLVGNGFDQLLTEVVESLRTTEDLRLSVVTITDLAQLDAKLRDGVFDVLHFFGARIVVSAEALTRALGLTERRPRLVVLHAGQSDGIAASIAGSTEAVIGVRGDVTAKAAALFSRKFYLSLARGESVIRAVTDARRSIDLSMPGQRQWGLFTLYHRAGDIVGERRAVIRPQQPVAESPQTQDPERNRLAMQLKIHRRNLAAIEARLREAAPTMTTMLERERLTVQADIDKLEQLLTQSSSVVS